jgi:hypothetical protein
MVQFRCWYCNKRYAVLEHRMDEEAVGFFWPGSLPRASLQACWAEGAALTGWVR